MNDYEQIHAQWQEQVRKRRLADGANREAIFDALAALRIEHVEVRFDGYCDSGQIEEIAVTGGAGELAGHLTVTSAGEPRPCPLEEAVEELCYGLLECEHAGWQDNEGAFGTFSFEVARRSIVFEINARYTAYSTSVHSYGGEE